MEPCNFGARCFRKSAEHFESYSHPPSILERRKAEREVKDEEQKRSATPPEPAADVQPAVDASGKDEGSVFGRPAAPVFGGNSILTELARERGERSKAAGGGSKPSRASTCTGGDTRTDPVVLDSDDEDEAQQACGSASGKRPSEDGGRAGDKRARPAPVYQGAGGANSRVAGSSSAASSSSSGAHAPARPIAPQSRARRPNEGAWQADGVGFHLMASGEVDDKYNAGTVTLEDIFAGDPIWCIVSNYCQDLGLLFRQTTMWKNTRRDHWAIPTTVLIHAKEGDERISYEDMVQAYRDQVKAHNLEDCVTLHVPKVPKYGTHHSKFMILGHSTGLRVAVITSNTVGGDIYGAVNAVWAQDFPRKTAESVEAARGTSSPFEDDLFQYLQKTGWKGMDAFGADITPLTIRDYDFSLARATLIASVPGRHDITRDVATGEMSCKWGHLKLRSVLSQQTFGEEFVGAPIVWQCTSLGMQRNSWLVDMIQSFSAGKAPNGVLGKPKDGVRLVWPTDDEIRTSTAGWNSGGGIPGRKKNVDQISSLAAPQVKKSKGKQAARPEVLFHRWSNPALGRHPLGRSKVMPHIKSFMRHSDAGDEIAWILIGSHNLSIAAWGEIQNKTTEPFLAINSFELSVLIHPALLTPSATAPFSLSGPAFPVVHEQ
ncbi:tyrosyl-DNA phosphodiesterase-domain-containing protein, partial [Baffinella frigidus]